MIKYIYTLIVLFTSSLLFAQTEISLQINHKLGSDDFAFEQESENNLGDAFDITRLEYYISKISITHDNGTITDIEDTWILVDAENTTLEDLGDFDISEIESISFGIGVESDVNHLDPSSYPASHPLAPQSPSMHWGWSAGYRFVALEGNCGSSLDELLQIHALDDDNYFEQTIELSLSASNNEIIISLDADYSEALNGIDVSSGLINHGASNEAEDLLENFQNLVFSPTEIALSIYELSTKQITVYPNPVKANNTLYFSDDSDIERIDLIDYSGRTVRTWNDVKGSVQLDLVKSGVYILSIQSPSGSILSEKVIVE